MCTEGAASQVLRGQWQVRPIDVDAYIPALPAAASEQNLESAHIHATVQHPHRSYIWEIEVPNCSPADMFKPLITSLSYSLSKASGQYHLTTAAQVWQELELGELPQSSF